MRVIVAQEVAIIDIGSSKVTVLVGKRGVNNTVCITGKGEKEYDGYGDGEFFRPDGLLNAVGQAVNQAQTSASAKIKHVYVGVPGNFTVTQCKEVALSFGKKRKITDEDINELVAQGDDYREADGYSLINCQPIYYTLGDNRKLIQPVGLVSAKITGFISYILAENKFINLLSHVLEVSGIDSYEFVSNVLAESLYLFDDSVRDRFAVLIDIGYIVTDIAIARGDGILRQFSFSFGGGHIAKELRDALSIRFQLAEKLKRKITLNLEFGERDTYDITMNDRTMSFPARQVNEIVTAKLGKLARTIKTCLMSCDLPSSATYYLTGGGISYMPGAREYLTKKLDREIVLATPRQPQYKKPEMSSALALLDTVLDNGEVKTQKKSFFDRLFGR